MALILASKRMHLMAFALMLSGLWIFQWANWLKIGVTKHNLKPNDADIPFKSQ